ncbi:T9SS type A sorting domain-containing protein [Nonlabens mediterrranea]|uniref:T9SS type A sorting domain-containing protein n=1 Tax=Nonlabens mediterrranea TaxID=1419947 RepID=A0ABS0A8W9_9FLAO|nr:T9SS type A sorting domain-containing protein [Nonlabens mediterrranea]
MTGLTPGVLYDFYIQSECGNQVSTLVGPLLVPGNYNTITGTITYDQDNNGCSVSDPTAAGVLVQAVETTTLNQYTAHTDANGNYTLNVLDGTFIISNNFSNPSVSVSPVSPTLTFPNATSSAVQDFCLTPAVMQEDVAVTIIPVNQARPGFDSSYRVIVTNQSTLPVTDVITFTYQNDYMTFLTAVPAANSSTINSLSWNFSLNPFDSEIYTLDFNLNPPTHPTFPLNGSDILNLSASTYVTGADVDLTNNTFDLDQVVVNSYDPNDKTCLQGETIDPSMVGEYLDYLIRFENTGTASAINVRIKDVIDVTKFDITSLMPLDASHDYYMSVTNGNEVEFHFDNINLDFNDATNDGHVLFKIKTLGSLNDGDSFSNTAEIYFDFNFPIITNTEIVTIMSTASINETTDSSISIYPNPTTDFINLSSSNRLESATIVDMNGRVVDQVRFRESNTEELISLERLKTGLYFIKINSDIGLKVEKLIIE